MSDDLRLPVEVDAYSDPRWSRIERDVFAKLDETPLPQPVLRLGGERRRGLAWTLVFAAAAFAVALFHPWTGARSNERLRLETTDSASQFTVGESSLTVAPLSLVMVGGDDEHGINVVLDRGRVTCEVAPRNGRPPFVVDAGDVRVRVVGTRFTVARDPTGTWVDVERGVVEVMSRGVVTMVREGQHWPAAVVAKSGALSVAPPAPGEPPPPAPAAFSSSGSHVPATSRSRTMGSGGPATSQTTPMQPWPEDADKNAPAAAPSATPQAASPPSPQQLFESAALVERTRPDEAAAVYRRLAGGTTAWAPNALYALARLEADRGHRGEAVGLLNDYLSRYPHGFNSDDARSLLQRMR